MNSITKIFTIGSSDRSVEDFVGNLKKYGINILVDVRSRTGSRVLHFDEKRFKNLSRILKENGVVYHSDLHEVLGGFQNGKTTLGNFRKYTETPAFKSGLTQLINLILDNPDGAVAIMCCERDTKQCHRKIIADILENRGWSVTHI